jgi:hypothetical protein
MVFQMEAYDGLLINLTKRSKVNFLRFAKRNAMRDFRISMDQLMSIDEPADIQKGKKKAKLADATEE